MVQVTSSLDLHTAMLAHLFDPDKGLAEEITTSLNVMAGACEAMEKEIAFYKGIDNHPDSLNAHTLKHLEAKFEIAEAQLEFFTDVWTKIRTMTGEQVVAPVETPKPAYHFSAESDLLSDIGLHVFLVSVKQREGAAIMSYEARKGLAQDLLSRGWHKDGR